MGNKERDELCFGGGQYRAGHDVCAGRLGHHERRLRCADGEEAALELRDGRFRVTAARALPGRAKTPEEALDQLRRVLARRSYAGLMRVVSPATRASMEADLRALVDGLDNPASSSTCPMTRSS